jgi:N-methylhydantoinase A
VLGQLNPDALVGGELAIDAALAREAIEREVARPLGMTAEAAAAGAVDIAVATMTRAVKAVSTYRGRDPRGFSLVAFGGNGPVFAAAIADALDITHIVVPPRPGVFSAVGLMVAAQEAEAIRSIYTPLDRVDATALEEILEALTDEGVAGLDVAPHTGISARRSVDLKYAGQAFELKIPIGAGVLDLAALAGAFHEEHRRTYGHAAPDSPIDVVTLSVVARAEGADAGRGRARDAGGSGASELRTFDLSDMSRFYGSPCWHGDR